MKNAHRHEFRHFCPISTRWGDVDRLGHINNAKYFTYDEQGRTDYLWSRTVAAGLGQAPGANFILARIGCDFIVQLEHPSKLDLGIRALRLGTSSIMLRGALFVGGVCHAVTESVVVWFDYKVQQAKPLPISLREEILNFEAIKPEE